MAGATFDVYMRDLVRSHLSVTRTRIALILGMRGESKITSYFHIKTLVLLQIISQKLHTYYTYILRQQVYI